MNKDSVFIPGKPQRNKAADKRANALKLQPRPAQTNQFKEFMVAPRKTDIEIIETIRAVRSKDYALTGRSKANCT